MCLNGRMSICTFELPPILPKNVTEKRINCLVSNGQTIEHLATNSPFAIIKYGPPGSGKGSAVVTKEIENLGYDLNQYAVFEIDKVVENVKNYRNKTVSIKENRNSQRINNNTMYNRLSKAYFNTRKTRNNAQKTLNTKFEDVLVNTIHLHKKIIFETTGTNSIQWLLDLLKKNQYKIILIYPLVNETNIINRTRKRANAQYQQPANKRLYRAINPLSIKSSITSSQSNFINFVIPSVLNGDISKLIVVHN